MGLSYAGDQLQVLAQAWLVATISQSAFAVGVIGVIGAVPQLFMPLGGVVADQVDRRRLLITGQLLGAGAAVIVGILVLTGQVALWHIYAWAFLAGLIWLVSRPAFKVMLTESVPREEVPAATGLNSMTETSAMVVVNSVGSGLLAMVGLPLAFLFNGVTYLLASLMLCDRGARRRRAAQAFAFSARRIVPDLHDGLLYLARQPLLLVPMLSTLVLMIAAFPAFGLLAAIVYQHGGSLMQLGLLSAAGSLGGLAGAGYAGVSQIRPDMRGRYGLYGLAAAVALATFAILPIGYATMVPLAALGFVIFAEAVWNTSRVRLLAEPSYQARLQALTTMAFTLGGMVGLLWGGVAVDHFGPVALLGSAGALAVVAVAQAIWSVQNQRSRHP
jgi:predicted MFS family arabinose efflux permease